MIDFLVKNLHYIIILYLGWSFYGEFQLHTEEREALEAQIPVIQSNIQRRKNELAELKRFEEEIRASRDNIIRVARELERIQQKLPAEISTAENMTIIRTLAEGLNMQRIRLQPQREENMGFYYRQRFRFNADATFLQFLIFFEKLNESSRLLNVGEVSLKRSQQQRRGRFQIVEGDIFIESYRHNEAHREKINIEEIEAELGGGQV